MYTVYLSAVPNCVFFSCNFCFCQCNYVERKEKKLVSLQFIHRIIVMNSLMVTHMTCLPFSGLSLAI